MSNSVIAERPAVKAAPTATVEVWIVVDENGDSAVGPDQAAALASYDEHVGRDDDSPVGLRFARVTLTVPLPVTAELTGTVPVDDTPATLAVA